jgi:hypothetical protein
MVGAVRRWARTACTQRSPIAAATAGGVQSARCAAPPPRWAPLLPLGCRPSSPRPPWRLQSVAPGGQVACFLVAERPQRSPGARVQVPVAEAIVHHALPGWAPPRQPGLNRILGSPPQASGRPHPQPFRQRRRSAQVGMQVCAYPQRCPSWPIRRPHISRSENAGLAVANHASSNVLSGLLGHTVDTASYGSSRSCNPCSSSSET